VRRGSSGGPVAKRVIVRDQNDAIRQQLHLRTVPLHAYRFDFGVKTLEAADEVRDFFYVVMFGAGGPYDGFRVRDWNDYELTQANSRLVATTGGFQICRVYAVGAVEYLRPVKKIEPGSATVFNAGVPVGGAVVDNNTGIVTSGGNAAYTVEARFDIPVTFRDDDALANIALDGNVENILQALGEVALEELP
jgi:uncharacterized protein (TIGR02217 family)